MPEPKIAGDVSANGSASGDESILARKYGEVVVNTLSSVVSVLEYPKGKFLSPSDFYSS